jgi:hypothetical protein
MHANVPLAVEAATAAAMLVAIGTAEQHRASRRSRVATGTRTAGFAP